MCRITSSNSGKYDSSTVFAEPGHPFHGARPQTLWKLPKYTVLGVIKPNLRSCIDLYMKIEVKMGLN